MGWVKEFKDFAVKGNVVDLAVGVIIGAAFAKIVDSVVNDILMPPLGFLMGKLDFKNQFVDLAGKTRGEGLTLDAARKVDGAVIVAWGSAVGTIVQFILMAFVVFWLVKGINRLRGAHEATPEPAGPSSTDQLLMEIRDSLKKG